MKSRRLIVEVALVLGATVLPALVNATWTLARAVQDREDAPVARAPDALDESLGWLSTGVAMLTWVVVYVLVVSRAGEPLRFGLVPRPRLLDALLAVALYFAYLGVHRLVPPLLQHWVDAAQWPVPQYAPLSHVTALGTCAFAVAMVLNAVAEELIVRSYLLTRLEQILGSAPLAVLGSASVYGLYHLWQGPLAALCVAIHGLLFGFVFVLRRSIWPVVLPHAALDLAL